MSAQDTAAGAVIPRLMLRMNQPAPLLSKVLIALLHYLNSAAYWTTAGESVPPQSTPVKLRGGSFCPAWQASVVYEEESVNPMDILAPLALVLLTVLPVYVPCLFAQTAPTNGIQLLIELIVIAGTTTAALIQMLLHFHSLAPLVYTAAMHCALHLAHHLHGVHRIYALPPMVVMAARAATVVQWVLAATLSKPLHPSTLATSHLASLVIPELLGYAILGASILFINFHSKFLIDLQI